MDPGTQQSGKLSIASAILSQVDRLGSYSRLEEEIILQNGSQPERKVDRRKLKRIAEGDQKLTLNLQELLALDVYLTQFGEGLSDKPLFQRSRLLEPFADDGDVTFLLGVRPEKDEEGGRNALSQWDVNAMTTLIKGLFHLSPTVHFDFLDAIYSEEKPDPNDSWVAFLEDDRRTAISIGSPRVSRASEYMLSRMFGRKPMDGSSKFTSPFRFSWPEGQAIGDFLTAPAASESEAALHLEDETLTATAARSYAVVAAQRRPRGHLWLVLAGLTGPMTYAAALAAKNLIRSTTPASSQGPSEVHWSVVDSSIHFDSGAQGDPRRVVDAQRVIGPRVWKNPNQE